LARRCDWNRRLASARMLPVRFRRALGMLPLPVPERSGSIEALQSFLNLSNLCVGRRMAAGRVAIERSLSAARNSRRAGLD
jgi:hypothetical protein